MLCCRDAARLASKRLDATLTLRERWGLWLHLRACEGCRRYREQVQRLREWVRRSAEDLASAGLGLTAEEQMTLIRALAAAEPESP